MNDPLAEQGYVRVDARRCTLKTSAGGPSDLQEVEKVLLFGSYRNGQRDLFTDLHLLVVMQSSEESLAPMRCLCQLLGGKMGVDCAPVPKTPEEVDAHGEPSFLQRSPVEDKLVYQKGR